MADGGNQIPKPSFSFVGMASFFANTLSGTILYIQRIAQDFEITWPGFNIEGFRGRSHEKWSEESGKVCSAKIYACIQYLYYYVTIECF